MSGVKRRTRSAENEPSSAFEIVAEERLPRGQAPLGDSWLVLLAISLVIRTFNSFTITTFFQPDEYYQALEPAHRYVFGYGFLTWEWKQALRSSLHPYIYILGYKLTSALGPESVFVVPKAIGAVIGALGDLFTYKFALKASQTPKVARIALSLSFLSPFNWYVVTRSFSNSFEMVLTAVSLTLWDLRSFCGMRYFVTCLVAMVTCVVRPTNAIIWVILGAKLLKARKNQRLHILAITAAASVVVLGASALLDFSFYGRWTFPLVNFFEFNVFKNLSIFYGVAPWHFYIFQAIPLIHMLYLPVFLYSVVVFRWYTHIYGVVCLATIGMFSALGHKEFRFIYPLQPIFILITATGAFQLMHYRRLVKPAIVALVVVNASIAFLFTRVNEKGVIDIIEQFRQDGTSFGLLTPCHSTPWQSHLHNAAFDESSWFLSCEPPLHLEYASAEALNAYRDESDQFFDDPERFLSGLGGRRSWPARLVVFQPMEAKMDQLLPEHGYHKCDRVFNSYFHWDPRRSGDLVVYCK